VDVRVHDPRHEDRVAAVDPESPGRSLVERTETLDLPIPDVDGGRTETLRGYDPAAAQEEIGSGHQRRV
jgi:hypothetical protein